ncbi:hypothetical protein Tco_0533555 [Tanacetum coccineum]
MASSMSPKLQKTFENTWAYEMNQQLKEMFQAKASKEHLDVDKSLMACKSKPRASICTFVLEMKGYFNILESLYMVFDAELSIKIILSSLPADDLSKRSVSIRCQGYIGDFVLGCHAKDMVVLYSVMSDSDESGVTYTEVSSPFEGLSDIGSPRADDHEYLELPWMPEDPYVEAALQALPSPDYVPGPEEPEQAPPSPDYVPGLEHAK